MAGQGLSCSLSCHMWHACRAHSLDMPVHVLVFSSYLLPFLFKQQSSPCPNSPCAKHFTKAGPLLAEVAADLNSPVRNGHGLPNEKGIKEEEQVSEQDNANSLGLTQVIQVDTFQL